jgi:hypothetical protein
VSALRFFAQSAFEIPVSLDRTSIPYLPLHGNRAARNADRSGRLQRNNARAERETGICGTDDLTFTVT